MTSTLISTTLKAWHFLYKRGFIEGFGHISARIPDSDRFIIARHSLGPRATAADFLVLDLEGPFTTSEQTLRPIHLMGTIFHDGVPIYPDPRLVSNRQRGQALAKALGPHRAVLMRAHGAAITGASVEETVGGAFLFEENAHRACISAGLGKPVWIDEQTAADAGGELLENRGPFRRVWALVESDAEEAGIQDAVMSADATAG
ncbi:MAG: class II aldolase/adducin family protein [Betaproteobacteria bacterium]|nr:class II aldolase/adducin family protein [Betaproteobacteria bacterium]